MAKPLKVSITGPIVSKSGRTESQYMATVVAQDGSVRYLTWSSSILPDELADAIKDVWSDKMAALQGRRLTPNNGQRAQPAAEESEPTPAQ